MWFRCVYDVFLVNTLSGKKERFVPLSGRTVKMYSCGPTVYGPQHIGNLRAAVFSDVLARVLAASGYRVRKVVNITDVGHMVGDGDEGEDKMAVGAKRDHKTPKEIANRYAKQYLADIRALNVDTRAIRFPRATDYIPDQIRMIRALEKKGYAYRADDGIYFDVTRFEGYGKLGGMDKAELRAGARVAVAGGKRHPEDFALWRFAKQNDLQQWKSPWGMGNPGWSIECSAMSKALLGATLDIHTGGEDHIAIHHNNEIAQSEGANDRPLARYWLHNAFLTIDGDKISKSLGNIYTLDDIRERGIEPLAFRYFLLQAQYRSPLSFTWEALQAAANGYARLHELAQTIKTAARGTSKKNARTSEFLMQVRDDLATPRAIARLWELLPDDSVPAAERLHIIEAADATLGLGLLYERKAAVVPNDILALGKERDAARANKEYEKSDQLRSQIEARGYTLNDTQEGTKITKT